MGVTRGEDGGMYAIQAIGGLSACFAFCVVALLRGVGNDISVI